MNHNLLNRQESPAVADEAEKYLNSYLETIGIEQPVDSISAYQREIMADIPIMMQREPLTVPEKPKSVRDKMVAFFEKNNWLPRHRFEATTSSLSGIDETLRRAKHTRTGEPLKAQSAAIRSFKSYHKEAMEDVAALATVRQPNEDLTISAAAEKIRQNLPALYVLADNLHAREMLDEADWPRSNQKVYKNRQAYWRGFMIYAARYGEDKELVEITDQYFEKAQNRRDYWRGQVQAAEKKVGYLPVGDAVEIQIPHRGPDQVVVKSKRAEIESFEEMLSDAAIHDMAGAAREFADRTDQILRYVEDQGMTRQEAELKVLGRPAQWYKGHIVGYAPTDPKISPEAIERAKRPQQNLALKPGVRRKPGYDHERDPSNPQPF